VDEELDKRVDLGTKKEVDAEVVGRMVEPPAAIDEPTSCEQDGEDDDGGRNPFTLIPSRDMCP